MWESGTSYPVHSGFVPVIETKIQLSGIVINVISDYFHKHIMTLTSSEAYEIHDM